MKRAVFLDRDGVVNRAIVKNGKPYPPMNVSEVVIDQEVAPALDQLKNAGFLLIGVTNQPDVARGKTTRAGVEAINNYLLKNLPIDAWEVCYHDDMDRCACRKPLPGLLLNAARQWSISLPESYMIGDRWRDVDAGQAAGCKTIWIDANYNERHSLHPPTFRVDNLKAAADQILMGC